MNFSSHGIYNLHIGTDFLRSFFTQHNGRINFLEYLGDFLAVENVFLVDSGRTALSAALQLLDCKGKDVLVNAYTTDVVHNTIKASGANPVLFDISPTTLKPDMNSIKQLVTKNTVAIIHTGLFGFPSFPTELSDQAKALGIPVIEDICNSFGCITGKTKSGTTGDMSILSFRVGKPLSSGGGALIINNPQLVNKYRNSSIKIKECSSLKDHYSFFRVLLDYIVMSPLFLRYIARPIRRATRGTKLGSLIVKGGVVDTSSIPTPDDLSDMGNVQSRLAAIKLSEYSRSMKQKRESGSKLRALLEGLPLKIVGLDEVESWNGLFFPILLQNDNTEHFQNFCRSNGFDVSRFHYETPGMILSNDVLEQRFSGSAELSRRLVCLPCPSDDKSRNRLISVLSSYFQENKILT
ncbi:MAG: DegT/DnrJ/EryC1/StrS aminotransferase family protein [Candidatus Sabulitectum sp.]|nr:DegT/DnrJ/EryC1/StrS aminotransferase family protein [Candidatus Sabulitectum sp.]